MSRSSAFTTTTTATKSSSTYKKKAKCPQNQELLEKLAEHYEQVCSRGNSRQSKYPMTVRRALTGLQEHREVVTNYQEVMKVKGIGNSIASHLFPRSETAHSASPSSPTTTTTARATTTTTTTTTTATTTTKRNPTAAKPTSAPERSYSSSSNKVERDYLQATRNAFTYRQGPPLQWRVVILVDGRERKTKQNMCRMLHQCQIPAEERALPIGDILWVAQGRVKEYAEPTVELVLGTIIERKTLEDLQGSITGTRYAEQSTRLAGSGAPQIFYLVEGDIGSEQDKELANRCHSAIWELRLHKHFQVIQTKHIEDTVQVCKQLHRRIVQRSFPLAFQEEHLPLYDAPDATGSHRQRTYAREDADRQRRRRRNESLMQLSFDTEPTPLEGMERFITYKELEAKVKLDRSMMKTVGTTFACMLKQVAKVDIKKVEAVMSVYKTPKSLYKAYEACPSEREKEELLKDLLTQDPEETGRLCKVGPLSSRNIYIAFGMSRAASENSYAERVRQTQQKQRMSQSSQESSMTYSQESSAASQAAVTSVARMPSQASYYGSSQDTVGCSQGGAVDLTVSDDEGDKKPVAKLRRPQNSSASAAVRTDTIAPGILGPFDLDESEDLEFDVAPANNRTKTCLGAAAVGFRAGGDRARGNPSNWKFNTSGLEEDSSDQESPALSLVTKPATRTSSVADGEPPTKLISVRDIETSSSSSANKRHENVHSNAQRSAPPKRARLSMLPCDSDSSGEGEVALLFWKENNRTQMAKPNLVLLENMDDDGDDTLPASALNVAEKSFSNRQRTQHARKPPPSSQEVIEID